MAAPPQELSHAVIAIGESLLIGLLIGAQRETDHHDYHPGVRDFPLIALAAGICALTDNPFLTGATLLSIAVLLGVLRLQAKERTGITSEMAAVATFCLAFLTATPQVSFGAPLAIGLTIIAVALLETKSSLHQLVQETITEREFNDTLRFLAVVMVIYPVLPEGSFGPYNFFSPRQVWLFVILVSSISYVGYFLEKFLGAEKGMELTSVLGGLASTTAATAAFARQSAERPEMTRICWQSAVIANTVQFPRTFGILCLVNMSLARAALWPLAAMTAAGIGLAFALSRRAKSSAPSKPMPLGNPFRLMPALKFGVLFAGVLFISKAATVTLGPDAIFPASALGGLVDVATVAVALKDLIASGKIQIPVAVAAVFLALVTNAVLKVALSGTAGGRAFLWRMSAAFAAMFGAGAVVWAVAR